MKKIRMCGSEAIAETVFARSNTIALSLPSNGFNKLGIGWIYVQIFQNLFFAVRTPS